jgi:hypothetical protein
MVFDETYPEPPSISPLILQGEKASKWTPQQLYDEVMFHGPAFRGTVSIDRCGTNGSIATLQALPAHDLVRSHADHTFVTDPVLLDQPGQVVGFWTAEHLATDYVIFPFRLEMLHVYGPKPEAGEYLTCQARIDPVQEQQIRSDLDVVGQDGRLWARFIGWEDRRFGLPTPFFRFIFTPGEIMLSEAWPQAVAARPNSDVWQASRFDLDAFPEGFFTDHGGIWRRVLAYLVLSRRERELWHNLHMSEQHGLEWLLGRVAAKDAVRRYLKQRHDMVLYPADIEIVSDDNGRVWGQGTWSQEVSSVPLLSLSYTEGVALAMVGQGEAVANEGD